MTGGIGCVQCGTRSNPCRCKVVGPTLGCLCFLGAAIIEWPIGACVYLFKHVKGRRIMAHPATVVYPKPWQGLLLQASPWPLTTCFNTNHIFSSPSLYFSPCFLS
ncbi:hypothetical protein PRUPE_3G158900 [Prunus persica]|uniref:Uncharacterized protein n=1 Tax=Prunus persica TaxID=3760 RepID=A0A251Q0U1_PRUPE|nr:hypothetical protein PRUPE_3G158900 [Prunus persica]